MHDSEYMKRALTLAAMGKGRTSPNPVVGCVITNEGKIVGEGYHQRAGTPHAEIHALNQAGEASRGGTLYVTLEPCAHYGRTPPCVEAIIAAGVKKVVAAIPDPNPQVAGKGFARLRDAGIEVSVGIMADESIEINQPFLTWVTRKRPWVLLKWAMTLDGKIATSTGDSRWVSGPDSRRKVHEWRDQLDGVLVGIGTVLADDPQLTTRLESPKSGSLTTNGRNPVRIILDTFARTPSQAKVLSREALTVVAVGEHAPEKRVASLLNKGVNVIWCPLNSDGRIDIGFLLNRLAQDGLTSLLVEGGSQIHSSFLQSKMVDGVAVFMAPKIVGGSKAPTPVGGSGVEWMKDAWSLKKCSFEPVGEDWLITGTLQEVNPCLPEL